MADKPPEVKPIEALTMFEAKPVNKSGLSKELGESIDSGKKYRELLAKGVDATTVWEQMRQSTEQSVSDRQIEDMTSQFGAGMTKREKGKIEIDDKSLPKDLPQEEGAIRASFESGSKAMESVKSYLHYAEVIQEANATKRRPDDVLKEKYPTENWIDMRKQALDQLAATGIFQNMDPKFQTYGPHHQHEIIEQYLAADPALKNKVGQAMKAIETRMAGLPKVEKGQDYEQMQAQQKQALEKMRSNVENYTNRMRGFGIMLDPDVLLKQIQSGQAPEMQLMDIRKKVIDSNPVLKAINEMEDARKELADAEEKKRTWGKSPDLAYKADVEKSILEAKTKFTGLETTLKKNMSLADFQNNQAIFKTLNELTSPEAGGAPLMQAMQDLKTYHELERSFAGREGKGKKEEQLALSRRLREEAGITRDLENLLSNAIVDVMIDRSGKVLEAKNKEQAEKEEKDNKDKDEKQEEMKKKVKEGMEHNWIKYDKGTRKKTVDKAQIGQDMRLITYEGDDGIKRLMLRDMGRADWESVDLDSLDDDTKRYLKAAHDDNKDTYRDKLLTDYFIARSSSGSNRDLNLKDHEWELLNHHFHGVLEQRLNSSKEAQAVLKKLEDSGIKPGSNLKWLLYALLFASGAALAIPAALAAQPLIASAAGSGAIGIGGLLK